VEKLERELKEQVRFSTDIRYISIISIIDVNIMYMQIVTYVIIIYFPYKKLQTS